MLDNHFKLIIGVMIAVLIALAFLDVYAFRDFKTSIRNQPKQYVTYENR
jgi:hypothetical protein